MRETILVSLAVVSLVGSACAAGPAYTAQVREDCKPAESVPEGGKAPTEGRAGCFGEHLVIPQELELSSVVMGRDGPRAAGPRDSNFVLARWAVCADGAVGSLHLPQFHGTEVAKEHLKVAIWRAVQSCEWRPGTDAAGRPQDMWMSAPIELRQ